MYTTGTDLSLNLISCSIWKCKNRTQRQLIKICKYNSPCNYVPLSIYCVSVLSLQGKYMDIEFDYQGNPVGGIITNCKC